MYQRAVLLSLPKAQSLDIEFTNVTYEALVGFRGPKKTILKAVNGCFKSGELTAIMGPSGAGKSTLLNILTGFEKNNWRGRIEYTGTEGKHTWSEYRKESCYIQQDDQLHPLFSVMEAMWMAIDLKIGSCLSRKAKQMLIDDILDNLDLTKTKETRCSQLSGGQKKRLSIALELVDNPPVMFLDEPTTGLDSLSSHQVISMLQSLARAGRTIVCTIHQPSAGIYEMIDHVYLLAGGRCMYEGAPVNTVSYFSSIGLRCPQYHNPADYMIEVVSGEYGNFSDQLAQLASSKDKCWRATAKENLKNEAARYVDEGKATVLIQPPSEFGRFCILVNRCTIQLYRDWTVTHLKLVLHFMVGVLLGLLYTDAGTDGSKTITNVGFFLVTTVYLCYTSLMPAVLKFPSELPTLRKERFNNWYQLRTYYAASLISNLPVQVLFALVYSSVSYFLSSQPMDVDRFLMFLGVATLTTLIAESLGLVIGTLLNPVNGTFVGAISTCAMLTVAGFLALYSHMPKVLLYVSYVSYLKYVMHAFVHAIYGFEREKLPCPSTNNYCHYRMPQVMMDELSMSDGKYWIDVVILVCNYIFLRVVAYCTLKRKLMTV